MAKKFAVTLTVLIDADDYYGAQDIVLKGVDVVGGKRDWTEPLLVFEKFPCITSDCDEYVHAPKSRCEYCLEEENDG